MLWLPTYLPIRLNGLPPHLDNQVHAKHHGNIGQGIGVVDGLHEPQINALLPPRSRTVVTPARSGASSCLAANSTFSMDVRCSQAVAGSGLPSKQRWV